MIKLNVENFITKGSQLVTFIPRSHTLINNTRQGHTILARWNVYSWMMPSITSTLCLQIYVLQM